MMTIAVDYLKQGLSVIPVGYKPPGEGEKKGSKTPLIKWKEFQEHQPTENQVRDWWRKWPNAMVGVITGSISKLCTIDVDDDIGYGELVDVIPSELKIPTYDTPSGGCQMVFKMPNTELSSAVRNIPGCDLRAEGGIAIFPPSKNPSGSYVWKKGLSLSEVAPPPLPDMYIKKISSISSSSILTNYKGVMTQVTPLSHIGSPESQLVTFSLEAGSRNDGLFHIATSLLRGGMSSPEVSYVINNIAKTCTPPLRQEEVNTIIESACTRKLGRSRNIRAEVENWVRDTTGHFGVTSCYIESQIVTKEEKHAARQTFYSLAKQGIIEKVGNKDGYYQLANAECGDIDFINADTTPFDVSWPLGIHEYVKIYRKSIIVVAGESNAGKTAYCLNVARDNKSKHDINYFLSEGDPAELRVRLEKFEDPLTSWSNVKFKTPKGANLSKVIKPDGFNIIDYLEIHKDFYEVSGVINEIYERLNTGIAVIAMQKPPGRDLGIGGRGTLDKARLYLSISSGVVKIVKGKIWAIEGYNPNDLYREFSLLGGCNFCKTSSWKK